VSVSYIGTGQIWWDSTAYYSDPNTAYDYGLAFDGDSTSVTKDVMFKRYGDKDTRQGTSIATAFNFSEPFTGKINIYMDFKTSPTDLESAKVEEFGAYYLSFTCAKSMVLRGEGNNKGKSIVVTNPNYNTYNVMSETMLLSEVPDSGLTQGFELDVEDCHGIALNEISTSLMSINGGRLVSYIMYRRIRDISFTYTK
jgi:hypothetical protein